MTTPKIICATALLAVAIAVAGATGTGESVALADVLPPDTQACGDDGSGKADEGKVGNSCQTGSGSAGKCLKSRCSKPDYDHWDRDASPAPPSIEYDCLRCTPPAATGGEAGTPVDAGNTSSSSGGSASGCSTTACTVRTAGPWLLGLVVALAMQLRRKRGTR
jgi:hypothetical protein